MTLYTVVNTYQLYSPEGRKVLWVKINTQTPWIGKTANSICPFTKFSHYTSRSNQYQNLFVFVIIPVYKDRRFFLKVTHIFTCPTPR